MRLLSRLRSLAPPTEVRPIAEGKKEAVRLRELRAAHGGAGRKFPAACAAQKSVRYKSLLAKGGEMW